MDRTPPPVMVENLESLSRGYRVPTPDSGVHRSSSVKKITMPLIMGLSLAGLAFGVGVNYSQHASHGEDKYRHLNAEASQNGGGPAFKNDVNSLRNDVKWLLIDQERKTRRLLRGMQIHARKRGDDFVFRIELPEENE